MEGNSMIEMDKTVYEKMIGIWSITSIPNLLMAPRSGEVFFSWRGGDITQMPFKMFDDSAPIELVEYIEDQIKKKYGVDAKQFRTDLSGYRKDPFSSQN
tara:strand:- start:266 stop:562 length:297 start_codon:yes stop_codon:yes gene_type:complete